MAIVLNDSIRVAGNKPVEDKRLNNGVPYTSVAEVNSLITITDRYPSLEVLIRTGGVNFIYWYKDGIDNEDLILKQEGGGGEGTLPGVMVFRDTVPTKPDLNALTGQKQGDVYGVVSESKLYVWIVDYANIPGNNIWKDMGVSVDFSDYYKKGEINTKLNSYVLTSFLNQNFYNKTDVDNKLTSVLREQPNVDSFGNLPSTGNKVGDIRKAGNYRYIFSTDIDGNGTDGWDILVPLTDLRNYYTSAETEAAIANKNYITAAYLANYATQSWVTAQGYATNTDLALKQDKSAKVAAWSSTVSDNNYPSEKLVKDSLDTANTNANNKLDKTTATNQSVVSTVTFSNTVTIPKLVMTTQTSNTTVSALWSDGTAVYFNGTGGTPKALSFITDVSSKVDKVTGSADRFAVIKPDGNIKGDLPADGTLAKVLGVTSDNLPAKANTINFKAISTTISNLTAVDLTDFGVDRVDCPNLNVIYFFLGSKWIKITGTEVL